MSNEYIFSYKIICFIHYFKLKNIKFSIWQKLVNDEVMRGGLINCVVEVPSEESYSQIKNIFNDTTDANMYLILETMAYSLNYIDDALYFSSKIQYNIRYSQN
jgi:hypothetical protein